MVFNLPYTAFLPNLSTSYPQSLPSEQTLYSVLIPLLTLPVVFPTLENAM